MDSSWSVITMMVSVMMVTSLSSFAVEIFLSRRPNPKNMTLLGLIALVSTLPLSSKALLAEFGGAAQPALYVGVVISVFLTLFAMYYTAVDRVVATFDIMWNGAAAVGMYHLLANPALIERYWPMVSLTAFSFVWVGAPLLSSVDVPHVLSARSRLMPVLAAGSTLLICAFLPADLWLVYPANLLLWVVFSGNFGVLARPYAEDPSFYSRVRWARANTIGAGVGVLFLGVAWLIP